MPLKLFFNGTAYKKNIYVLFYYIISFNLFAEEKEKKKLDNEIDFLRSLEVLSNWSYTDAKYLFYHTIKKTFPIKTCMYKVGDEANNFYIIRSGEFQIDIAVTLPVEGTLLFKQQSEKFSSKYNISSKNRSITKYLKFAILSKNEYFGFEELLDNKKRNHRVTCISELGEVSIIYKKEFLRRIVSDQKTKNHLIKMSEKHEEMKQARINEFLNLERKYGILKKPSILDQYSEFQQNNINKTFNTPTPQSKLMLSQTFPDNDRNLSLIFKSLEKSTLSKLESTKNPNLNLRTEASGIFFCFKRFILRY